MELDDTISQNLSNPARVRWVDALTTAGWCIWFAYLGIIAIELRRAFAITTSSFEDGVWGQRVETISFVAIPQNSLVLVAAALCVALASIVWSGIHPDDKPPRQSLQRLATMIGGVAIVVIGVALLGIGGIPFRYADPLADLGALVGRIAGIAIAASCLRLTRLAAEE
jgi:hypothetical protein